MRCIEIPALIDPHVHFRVPGGEYKEDWKSGALAAVHSGVTTVLDMPNNAPPCVTSEALRTKKEMIQKQLDEVGVPLRFGLYLGADKYHLDEIEKIGSEAVGIKVFMGCSTGGLVVDTDEALEEIFKIAAACNHLVAVHAEDEEVLKARYLQFKDARDPSMHSVIRNREAAISATTKALDLAAKYNTRLYILHLSTKEELECVRQAKMSGIPVYAEATTHHLFLTQEAYTAWGTFVQVNPPLRTFEDKEALWEGIREGIIDTIGTDHAPHTIEEKKQPFGKAPSGIPGVETLLPLLLNAVNHKRLTLDRLIELTRTNPEKIFSLPAQNDTVLVDLDWIEEVQESRLKSKAGWTPYAGWELQGWPLKTVLRGKPFVIREKVEGK